MSTTAEPHDIDYYDVDSVCHMHDLGFTHRYDQFLMAGKRDIHNVMYIVYTG